MPDLRNFVVRKDDHQLYIKSGFCDFASGQDYDSDLYEVINELLLPEDATQEIPKNYKQLIEDIFMAQPTATRAKLYSMKPALDQALLDNDNQAALAILQDVTPTVKTQDALALMTAIFEN